MNIPKSLNQNWNSSNHYLKNNKQNLNYQKSQPWKSQKKRNKWKIKWMKKWTDHLSRTLQIKRFWTSLLLKLQSICKWLKKNKVWQIENKSIRFRYLNIEAIQQELVLKWIKLNNNYHHHLEKILNLNSM